MQTSEQIQFKTYAIEVNLNWNAFDGDDCFNDFHILIISGSQTHRFDFGPCAVHCLRKWTKFLNDPTKTTVGAGFRNPDIRYCDLSRFNNNYKLVITFEGSNLREEFEISNPTLHLRRDFLNAYDGI